MVKRLLRKYRYPPEGMEDAIQTVVHQAENWVDTESTHFDNYQLLSQPQDLLMVAENKAEKN